MSPSKNKEEEEIYDFDAVSAEEFRAARPLREAAFQRREKREALEAQEAKAKPGQIFHQKGTTR